MKSAFWLAAAPNNPATVIALEPSRVLRSLAEEGLIQIERREIRILDPQGLEAKAGLDN